MDFVAIDFETANSNRTSACSVGMAIVENDKITETKHFLIKPYPFYFDNINTSIHGITEKDVVNAPTFDILWNEISGLIENKVVVAHNAVFDISVLSRTLAHYNIPFPKCYSSCTYKLSRYVFPELGCYRLDFVSDALSVELSSHHNAECDAVACAEIFIKIINRLGINDLSDFKPDYSSFIRKLSDSSFDSDGHKIYHHFEQTKAKQFDDISAEYLDPDFVDKRFVFTGALTAFTRAEAMEIVKKGGGVPQDNITKVTNYLVVGKQDLNLVKDGFSGKMKKAIEYRKNGLDIEIIDEVRFIEMIDSDLMNLCHFCVTDR